MSVRSAHTIHRFNGLSSFMRKVALAPQSAERVLVSYRRVTATNVPVNWALRVVQTKKDTAHAVSLPTSNLIYLFSLSDPAPNSLRCATGRAALADATAGIAAAAP